MHCLWSQMNSKLPTNVRLALLWAERLVGCTLLLNGLLWVYWRLSLTFGGTRVEAPKVFKDGYGTTSMFLVGVIHGLGAETLRGGIAFPRRSQSGWRGRGLLCHAGPFRSTSGRYAADIGI